MRFALIFLSAWLTTLHASAAPITYQFAGTITSKSGTQFDYRLPGVLLGERFIGEATISPDAPLASTLSIYVSKYIISRRVDTISALTDKAGIDTLSLNIGSPFFIASGTDGFFRGEIMNLRMTDPTGMAIAVPNDFSQDFSGFKQGTFDFMGFSLNNSEGTSGNLNFSGQVDTWTRVPEPSTLVLFGAGMLGATVFRRRRPTKDSPAHPWRQR